MGVPRRPSGPAASCTPIFAVIGLPQSGFFAPLPSPQDTIGQLLGVLVSLPLRATLACTVAGGLARTRSWSLSEVNSTQPGSTDSRAIVCLPEPAVWTVQPPP